MFTGWFLVHLTPYLPFLPHSGVISQVSASAPLAFQAVKLLAQYFKAKKTGPVDKVLEHLDSLLLEILKVSPLEHVNFDVLGPQALCVCATIFLNENMYERALRVLRPNATQEMVALKFQVYLRIDREDLAKSALEELRALDDESSFYLVSSGQLAMRDLDTKMDTIAPFFRELFDRFGDDLVPALNNLAAAYIMRQQYSEAEPLLDRAFELEPKNMDTLINRMSLYAHTHRPNEAAKTLRLMEEHGQSHPYMQSLSSLDGVFTRAAQKYK